MTIDKEFFTTLVLTILNIVILYIILKKFLFNRLGTYMDDRSNKIKKALDMAAEAQKKVEAMEEANQARLREVKEEGIQIMNTYQKKAEAEYNAIIEKAKEDSKIMIENARSELASEKDQLLTSIKDEIADMVLDASSKVLNENLDTKANRQLISNFIKENK